jgi:hypothetical protein
MIVVVATTGTFIGTLLYFVNCRLPVCRLSLEAARAVLRELFVQRLYYRYTYQFFLFQLHFADKLIICAFCFTFFRPKHTVERYDTGGPRKLSETGLCTGMP